MGREGRACMKQLLCQALTRVPSCIFIFCCKLCGLGQIKLPPWASGSFSIKRTTVVGFQGNGSGNIAFGSSKITTLQRQHPESNNKNPTKGATQTSKYKQVETNYQWPQDVGHWHLCGKSQGVKQASDDPGDKGTKNIQQLLPRQYNRSISDEWLKLRKVWFLPGALKCKEPAVNSVKVNSLLSRNSQT